MKYVLDLRGADTGGPVVPGRILKSDDVQLGTEDDLRRESKIVFLLHGFNVNRQNGKLGLLRLADRLPSASGAAIVAVLWPGDHWVNAISYPFEGNDADDSAAELVRFIDRVVTPGTTLSFVSHSLGARVAMESVSGLIGDRFPIGQLCLMAAAIDDSSVADPEKYRAASLIAERVAVLASRKDSVLSLAYPVGDLLQSFIFFWKDEADLALGFHGPRSADEYVIPGQILHLQIPDGKDAGHSDYIPAAAANQNQQSAAHFANEVIAGSVRPIYP